MLTNKFLRSNTKNQLLYLLEHAIRLSVSNPDTALFKAHPGAVTTHFDDPSISIGMEWVEWDDENKCLFIKPTAPLVSKTASDVCPFCDRACEANTTLRFLPLTRREYDPYDDNTFWSCDLQAIGFTCKECYTKECQKALWQIESGSYSSLSWRHLRPHEHTE